MKKLLILSVLFTLLFSVALFAGTPRGYFNKIALEQGDILDIVTNTGTTHCPEYILTADILETPGEVLSTETHVTGTIRIAKTGNGTTVPYYAIAYLQLGSFDTQWVAGNTIRMTVTHIATNEVATWDIVIPAGTTTILYNQDDQIQIVPPYPAAGYDLEVTSTPTGKAIWKDGVDTGQVTPYTFTPGEAGTYTLEAIAGYAWNPVSHVVPELTENTTINFVSQWINVDPLPAMNPVPGNGETIQRAWNAGELPEVLTWEPDPMGPAPQGYKIAWNGGELTDIGSVTTWTTPALGAGAYTWQVVPYINEPVGKSMVKTTLRSVAPSRSSIKDMAKGDAAECPVWGFTVAYDTAPVIIPPDAPTTVVTPGGSVEVTSDVQLVVDETVDVTAPVIVVLPNYNNLVNPIVIGFTGNGIATIEIEVGAGVWFPMAYYGGQWHQGTPWPMNGPGSVFFTGVDFDAKGDVIILISENTDPTLPVELSSFDAVLTAQNFVALTWTSESETEMLGYRVYRSETADVNASLMITPTMIPATNTSTTQTYKVEDHEVYVNNTYYYWLESVDYGTSHFHGPVSVTITGTDTPQLPISTVMGNVYPNPFRMGNNANIDVSVKAGETASVTVYNILGQAVKTFKVTEGAHKLQWNGRDSKGNLCGSGIYFYKLSSPSMNQTKKMVIIK